MRRTTIMLGGLAALALCAAGPAARAAADPYEPRSMRWEEDFSFLKTPPAAAPTRLESLKFIPLTPDREAWLTLGGEVRQRLDIITDAQLGLSPAGSYDTAQTRLYLHADARLGPAARVFAQLSYADEGGRRPAARSFDESAPDLQQLFVDLSPRPGLTLRLGRQELPLGDQRLSEVRETFNLRRSFDAVRLDAPLPAGGSLTAFSGAPVLNRPGAFDDRPIQGERFSGLYASLPVRDLSGGLDLFWLDRRRPASTFREGTAPERRETFGARLFGKRGEFDFNLYVLGQTGRFGTGDIGAWAASADLGWTFEGRPWRPHLSLRGDIASGDRRLGDGRLGSFDAPYPNTSYLSTSSAYWPGNAASLFPLLTLHPRDQLSLYLGAQALVRLSDQDGFYYTAQTPTVLPPGGRLIMAQIYGRARWQPDRHWVLSATVIRQIAGDPVKAIGGQESNIVSVAADWKF